MEFTPETLEQLKRENAGNELMLSLIGALQTAEVDRARMEDALLQVRQTALNLGAFLPDRMVAIEKTIDAVLKDGSGSKILEAYWEIKESNAQLESMLEYQNTLIEQYMQIDTMLKTAQEHISRATSEWFGKNHPRMHAVVDRPDAEELETLRTLAKSAKGLHGAFETIYKRLCDAAEPLLPGWNCSEEYTKVISSAVHTYRESAKAYEDVVSRKAKG